MARVQGVTRGGSLLARFAFRKSRQKLGKVVRLVRVHALNTPLLLGYGQMESGQGKAKSFPPAVKALAKVRVAMRVGCPF
jgi:hypothetical protein